MCPVCLNVIVRFEMVNVPFSGGKSNHADGLVKTTLCQLIHSMPGTQNFPLIVLTSFPTAISASFSFIQAKPIRVEFRETEPGL